MAKKILIVDDDLDIVKLLGARLKKNGYEVAVSFDAINAIGQAQKEVPDLIILDLKIPAGSGLEVCKQLKKSSHTCLIPVIIITAFPSPEFKKEAVDIGIEDFIAKPFDFADILSAVKRLLAETS